MQIETSRLLLRPFTGDDAAAAVHNSKMPSAAQYMPDMVLTDDAAAVSWIERLEDKSGDRFRVLAIQRKQEDDWGTGAVIGLVGVAPKRELDGEIEILFAVADEFQGQGYATEAAKAMVWWAFEQGGHDMLSALFSPENKAARRVVEKLGAVCCDTRTLPHDGKDCTFDYFRLYRIDALPGPEWDMDALDAPEAMAAFFDTRAAGYDDHMQRSFGETVYTVFRDFLPETEARLDLLDLGCGTGMESLKHQKTIDSPNRTQKTRPPRSGRKNR